MSYWDKLRQYKMPEIGWIGDPPKLTCPEAVDPEPTKSLKAKILTRFLGFDPYEVMAENAVINEMYMETGRNGWHQFQRAERLEQIVDAYRAKEGTLEDVAQKFVPRETYDQVLKNLHASTSKLVNLSEVYDRLMQDYDKNIIQVATGGKK